eukprot:gnl/TRDRNA2_/TRDRNA2_149324_c4_seq1.p1 gnl/TRDRNA2_/TRDRNA2_149324_c4~~gnl/TRDRNA2_/TRDRNA2_149324_c4_seq1.p1  ORF type:complete len:469 (+),score=34.32 gnl/TRDRNA2_/TRDRNA2_149324_c4_seq1:213-1409(+)
MPEPPMDAHAAFAVAGCMTVAGVGGGMAELPCVFPFTFNNAVYNACTLESWTSSWCGTTAVVTAGSSVGWGLCASSCPGYSLSAASAAGVAAVPIVPSVVPPPPRVISCRTVDSSGVMCAFPFTYKNVVYNICTKESWTSAWCGTMPVVVDGSTFGWGMCSPGCPGVEVIPPIATVAQSPVDNTYGLSNSVTAPSVALPPQPAITSSELLAPQIAGAGLGFTTSMPFSPASGPLELQAPQIAQYGLGGADSSPSVHWAAKRAAALAVPMGHNTLNFQQWYKREKHLHLAYTVADPTTPLSPIKTLCSLDDQNFRAVVTMVNQFTPSTAGGVVVVNDVALQALGHLVSTHHLPSVASVHVSADPWWCAGGNLNKMKYYQLLREAEEKWGSAFTHVQTAY